MLRKTKYKSKNKNTMQIIDNFDFSGKKAIIRVDFNVPLNKQFEVTDDTRIRRALPTIKKILSSGGSVILMSHLGRPKAREEQFSLKHVVNRVSELLETSVKFATDCIGDTTIEMKKNLQPGEVLLLENLRYYKQENKDKDGMKDFAKQLAEGADVYVNDAFGSAHREHASTAVIAQFFPENKMFGFLMNNEVKNIEKMLNNPQRPFTAILGGAKVSDKIQIINNLLDKVDNLIIGGGMTYTFIKAQGGNIGKSIVEEDKLKLAVQAIEIAKKNNVNLLLPVDNVIADDFNNDANTKTTKINEVDEGWMGLDIAEETIKLFSEAIENSKTILWNGPMGVFEMENFQKGTASVANAIVKATANGAFSLIGGGDSVAAINKYKLADKVSYVSTGGGAMLESIEGKVLPGIKAIKG